jgi:hypothetical protein
VTAVPLPKGLEFLHYGWWVIHVVAIVLIWTVAYRRGRRDERRDQRARAAGSSASRGEPPISGSPS